MAYNRRDRIGHWVRKRQAAHQHCEHACCRGYREHPKAWPVVPPNWRLRGASDDELAAHFDRVAAGDTGQHRYAENQILKEMQRRDDRQRRQAEREAERGQVRAARAQYRAQQEMGREAEAERIRTQAEEATKGLVNAQGRARGITDSEILTGRVEVFKRYATDEAKEYFESNPRPTRAYLRYGRDTRVGYTHYLEDRRPRARVRGERRRLSAGEQLQRDQDRAARARRRAVF